MPVIYFAKNILYVSLLLLILRTTRELGYYHGNFIDARTQVRKPQLFFNVTHRF